MTDWILGHRWELTAILVSGVGAWFSVQAWRAASGAKEAAQAARDEFFTRSVADELNECVQTVHNISIQVENGAYGAAGNEARRVRATLAVIAARSSGRLQDIASELQTARQQVRDIVLSLGSDNVRPSDKKKLRESLGDVLESLSSTIGTMKSKLDKG